MEGFIAAACQTAATAEPAEAVLKAAAAGARLVVLPARVLERSWSPRSGSRPAGPSRPGPGRRSEPRPLPGREELLSRAADLARRAGCYLAPGTVVVPPSGGGPASPVAWLFSPTGELLGEQVATHLTREEEAAGAVPADELRVFDVDGVGVGLLVGLDVWVPEVSRILALEGAVVLLAHLALPAPYSEARQLAGVWQEVQQNQVFGVEACLVGSRDGTTYAGRSAVTAPCEMTPGESGFVVRAPSPETAVTLLGAIDLAARRRVIESYDIFAELNVGLYRRVFPQVYLAAREAGAAGPPTELAAGPPTEPTAGPPTEPAGRDRGAAGQPPGDRRPRRRPGKGPENLGFKERLFRRYLTFVSRPRVVRRAVAALRLTPHPKRRKKGRWWTEPGLGRPRATSRGGAAAGEPRPPRTVRVAAIQLESFYARNVTDYVLRLGERFREAVAEGADLVAFPEYVTQPLIGLIPGVAPLEGAEKGRDRSQANPGPDKAAVALADVTRFMEPILRNVYFTLFAALAAAARVYVLAGATPMPGAGGKVYNVSHLFGPDGRLIGAQPKVHLFPRERTEGLSPGEDLTVFETAVGRLSLPVCMDATYFETYRLAALLGAEMLGAPVANAEPYNCWKLLRGAWPRVQETPVYAVQSTLVGEFLGQELSGRAAVFAPHELTPAGDGVLASSAQPTGPGLAVADLDLDALARFREEHPVFPRLNLALIRRYLPRIYEDFARRRAASDQGQEESRP